MKSMEQFTPEKGRSKHGFSLLKSLQRARSKSTTREPASKNNNNNNIKNISGKSTQFDEKIANTDTSEVVVERLSRRSSRRDIHADYAARMSRRKRMNTQENCDSTDKGSNASWGSRPIRQKRQSLRDMVKLKNKLKFERCDAIVSGGNSTNQNSSYDKLDLSPKSCDLLGDITNRSSSRKLYLSSECNIPNMQDSNINTRLSLNFDFPSKRASWSANGQQRFPAILSLPRQSPPPTDMTDERTSSRRTRETHGITYTSSSSECSSPEYGESNKKIRLNRKNKYKNRPGNLLLDASKRGHSRSVSDVLTEKPIKPQTPKPKFSPASSLKDLHFYFSMQNLEQRKNESSNNNEIRRSSSGMTRSLRDLQFVTVNNENKRHSLATVPIYGENSVTNNKKSGTISPEIRHRRSRTRPLSAVASNLKLQTSVIPEHVAVDPVTSPSDVATSPKSSTKCSTSLPRKSSLKDVPEITSSYKRSRISSECYEAKEFPYIPTRPMSLLDCGEAYQQLQQFWREGRQFMSSMSIPVDLDQLITKGDGPDGMTPELKHHATWSNQSNHAEQPTMLDQVFTPPEALWVEALFDHVTMDGEELGFNAGDVICVMDSNDSDWWWGCLDDKEGWVPASFVRVLVNQSCRRNAISTLSIPSAVQNEEFEAMSTDTSPTHQAQYKFKKSDNCDVKNGQVSNYDVTKRLNMRTNVVKEIMKSEKDFVNDLKNVIEGYLERCQNRPEMFTDEQVSTIFSNIEEIYELQKEFLVTLDTVYCHEEPYNSDIASAFLKHKHDFEIYSTYCNNHPKAIAVLTDLLTSKRYSNFFETCRLRQGMISISLDGFLLTPVQKICKYPLQLAELLKYTRDCHPAAADVKEALDEMTSVARMINERKRQTECVEKIAAWQNRILNWKGSDILSTSIELITSGLMHVLSAARTKPHLRMAYLFDRQIVFCKKDILRKEIHYYKSRINLDGTVVKSVEREADAEWLTSFSAIDGFDLTNTWKICSEDGAVVSMMFCKNDSDVTKWIQSFRKERELSRDVRRKETLISRDIKDAIIRSSGMKQNKADLVTNIHYRQRVKIMQGGGATESIFNTRNNFFNNIALKFAFLKRNNKQFESVVTS